jgi:hypothetical protein
MPIVDTDIVYRLSTTAGAAGDTLSSTPPASLGKYVSQSVVELGTPLHNIFDIVTGDESAAGDIEYRCVFVLNAHPSLTLYAAKAWFVSQVAGGATAAIGLDPVGNVAKGAASAQAATIANEDTAPAAVSFSAPTSKATGLNIGDLGPNQVRAIWIRRTVPAATGAMNNDGFTMSVEGDTLP